MDDGFVIDAAIAFSPDGSRVAVGTVGYSLEGDVRLWRLSPLTEQIIEQRAHGGTGVDFVNHGLWLAAGGSERSVVLYDVRTREKVAQLNHSEPVLTLVGSPDGRALATADQKGVIRVWSTAASVVPPGKPPRVGSRTVLER